jgi:hypothetical protein
MYSSSASARAMSRATLCLISVGSCSRQGPTLYWSIISTMGFALSIQLAGRVGSRGVTSKQPNEIMLRQLRRAMCSVVENSTLLPGTNTFGTRLFAPCTLKLAVL